MRTHKNPKPGQPPNNPYFYSPPQALSLRGQVAVSRVVLQKWAGPAYVWQKKLSKRCRRHYP